MYLEKTDIPSLVQAVTGLQLQEDESVMLLFAGQSEPDVQALIDQLNALGISFFGGLFPGLVFGNRRLTTGCIIKKFKTAAPPFLVQQISSGDFSSLDGLKIPVANHKRTALILIDGLTSGIYQFLEVLNDLFGIEANFLGAGAGSMTLKPDRCIFNNEGFFQNAAVVCMIEKVSRLGVRHGWSKIAGPMVATEAEGHTIFRLNWQNAFDVYKNVVEADSGKELRQDNFFDISPEYPFGMFRDKEDDIVRDPIATGNNGEVICIGEVPANTVLYILKGDKKTLLEAARQAVGDCMDPQETAIVAEDTLIIDCISRTLFLDEQFAEELDIVREQLEIRNPEQEPQGVLSLGEISSYGVGLLELFNKTIVVGTLNSA